MPFGFTSPIANNGLDTGANPVWQMVPLLGTRTLNVSGAGPGPVILQPFPRDTTVVKAAQTGSGVGHRVVLTGLKAGKTVIDWLPSAPSPGQTALAAHQLEVSVKAEKPLNTVFHYVNDGRVQKTTRAIADLPTLIVAVNKLLTQQANVKIVKKSAAELKVAQNLRKVVRFSSHLPGVAASQHEWDDLLALADATADYNVFFVKEYEQDATPLVDNVAAGTIAADKMCVMEDQTASPAYNVLAHETVHLLGIGGHHASAANLMTSANPGGDFISKTQANIINTSGT